MSDILAINLFNTYNTFNLIKARTEMSKTGKVTRARKSRDIALRELEKANAQVEWAKREVKAWNNVKETIVRTLAPMSLLRSLAERTYKYSIRPGYPIPRSITVEKHHVHSLKLLGYSDTVAPNITFETMDIAVNLVYRYPEAFNDQVIFKVGQMAMGINKDAILAIPKDALINYLSEGFAKILLGE